MEDDHEFFDNLHQERYNPADIVEIRREYQHKTTGMYLPS
jgi:hypothetical protein